MAELDPLKQAFITEELQLFADHLLEQARQRIRRRNIKVDEDLLNSLATQVLTDELLLKFVDWGRFHDMGAGRGYHKGKYMGSAERLAFLKGRKPSKWYSRLAWGSVYGTLVNNLSNKYIEAVPADLKKTFEGKR